MSRFDSALDYVLRELDVRRQAGYDDWRSSADAVGRLRGARAPNNSEPSPSIHGGAVLAIEEPAAAVATPNPSPAPSLLRDEAAVPPAGAAVASHAPAYEPVTDPALSKTERLAQLRACPKRVPCGECPYGQGSHSHVVFGVGNVDTEVMFIGEAPGAEEDARGEPFVGRAGQLLNKIIATMGYQREQIYLANILKCRPDTPGQTYGNRPPRPDEMASCRPCLFEQIDIIKPGAIVALGATAMKGLLDLDAPMRDLRGHWHDFHGIPVMATYHPSYLLRNQSPSEKRKVWEDLLLVKEKLGQQITERDRGYFLTRE